MGNGHTIRRVKGRREGGREGGREGLTCQHTLGGRRDKFGKGQVGAANLFKQLLAVPAVEGGEAREHLVEEGAWGGKERGREGSVSKEPWHR